ncbi:MAG: hypothetical protein KAR83_06800, partial [Thermodesulfovibrionales bacterium]|nr:hypothetical protein [Thermodesulfovibrionales bacterium]
MKLEHIAFLGRTFQEYLDMFGLTSDALRGETVLDCPAGPSSFVAEARSMGIKAIACDPCYSLTGEGLEKKAAEDLAHVFDSFDSFRDNYIWTYYEDKEQIISLRRQATERFLNDYGESAGSDRYVEAALSALPFPDNAFTMALSGHFLFLYEDWISIDQHLQYIRELLRVASREVRLYPLVTLEAEPYDYMGYIVSTLEDEGIRAEVDPV